MGLPESSTLWFIDEIIEEYVGANMGIQILLLVIDRRAVSVMSTCLPNP